MVSASGRKFRPVARAAGEEIDRVDAELDREAGGFLPGLMVGFRELGVGVQRVPVAAERADHEPALLDRAEERALLRLVAEQLVRVAVRAPRIIPRPELDGLDAERRDAVEHLHERQIREENGEDAELHACELRPAKAPTGVEPVYTALQAVA